MRLYYEIARRSFRRATIYRSAYIAGLLTNSFFGALRCFVYIALYGAGGTVAGFTLNDAISYTWLTQSLISLGGGWVDSHGDVVGLTSYGYAADCDHRYGPYFGATGRDLYDEASRIVVQSGQASISYLQRRLRIGFSRAARLVDMMEADGLVSGASGGKAREVLVGKDYFDEVDAQMR